MHYLFYTSLLAGLALAAPRPQEIDLAGVEEAPPPVFYTAPLDVVSNTPVAAPTSTIGPITTGDPVSKKRSDGPVKRDGNCAAQPNGSGPVPTPDTVSAFLAYSDYQTMATNAPTPDGYSLVFTNLQGSLSASKYMGLYTLTSFDTLTCAQKCDQAFGCEAFNIYIERDPSLDANAQSCPNPPSTINYKCTLWGAPVSSDEATNTGQYRDSFQVVITGSNAYNKAAPPPATDGFSGPVELGGAINAPNSYMGYQYFAFSQSQGYTPSTCAAACNAQTDYDSRHPASDCTYLPCVYFNAYVLSKNGVPQGLYCSMYNATWAPSYGTNHGQYRGSDRYTVSESYSYSLNSPPSQPAYASGCGGS